MKKKYLAVLLLMAILLTSIMPADSIVKAAEEENGVISGECGENVTWVLDEGTLTISGSGYMESYKYDAYAPWFNYREQIKNVVITSGVTNIGQYAFYECYNLETVEIPDTVAIIDYLSFCKCDKLTEITIPGSVTWINEQAFYCAGLTKVKIPDGVKGVMKNAFGLCESLEEVEISKTVEGISSNAFQECFNLKNIHVAEDNAQYCSVDGVLYNKDVTELIAYPYGRETVIIPESVTSLGDTFTNNRRLVKIESLGTITEIPNGAFLGCNSLEEIVLPESVTKIGSGAFDGCMSLRSIRIPDSVMTIGAYAFSDCGIEEIVLPESVVSIDDGAFYGNYALTEFTISNELTEIGDLCFAECYNLAEITIPAEVKTIGYLGFYDCTHLKEITFEGDAPELPIYTEGTWYVGTFPIDFEWEKPGDIFRGVTATVYYPENNETYTEEFMELCGGDIEWKMNVTIPNDETGIPDTALYNAVLSAADSNGDSILTLKEAEKITSLSANGFGISNLQGLSVCKNLVSLDLQNNQISDIRPIKDLNLESLLLDGNPVDDTLIQIENAEDGATVETELTDTTVLSQEVLEAMQGKDITLNITLENGIMWSMNGTNVLSEELADVDLAVEKTENGNISTEEITILAGDRVTETYIFAENGTLAFPMQLTTEVPTAITKEKAVLIQSVDDSLRFADATLVFGNALTFDLTEKADSIIVYGTNGDTNGDDSVSIKDTMQMLHHISNRSALNAVQNGFADVDMSNTVNLQDLMREMHYISGRIDNLYEAE